MARMTSIRNQRGFTIIEALFSVLVLSIGLLALAGFQAVALQDGTAVKMRMVATNLAQEKLDDLKGFSRLKDDPSTEENECDAAFCYTEIADDAGGALPAGELDPISGTVYERHWTVVCYNQAANAAPAVAEDCATAQFKLVTVTISWTDTKGEEQSVELQGVIYAFDPASMGRASVSPPPGPGPKVSYTPIGVPDAVPVPINTGGDKFKESSKPLPELSQSGKGIEVSFDSVVYTGDGTYTRESQEEFSTVGCECQFAEGGTGYTPTRKVWSGTKLVAQVGSSVSKARGVPLGNNPPNHCDICCRDHHDTSDSGYPKYDPQRPDSDYTGGGDHKHYWYKECVDGGDGSSSCTDSERNSSFNSETPLLPVTSGAYLESCRVMRVDGIWRVMQDWRLRKVTVFDYYFLQNSSNLDNYVAMVTSVVENAVKTDAGGSGVTITTLTGRDLPDMTPSDSGRQLLARAVYVDTIYGATSNFSTPDSAYYTALLEKISTSQSDGNADWMEYAPFYEANLTKLYDWTSSTPSIATVTSEKIDAIVNPASNYYGSFTRGKLVIQSGSTSGSTTIMAKARLANSGITGGISRPGNNYVAGQSFGTDSHDNSEIISDSIVVSRAAAGTTHSISGKIVKGNSSVLVNETGSPQSPLGVTANANTGEATTCTAHIGDADPNAWHYSCTVPNGWAGTLTFSSSGNIYSFNDASTTSLTTAPITVSAAYTADPVVAYGATATLTGYVYKNNYPSGNPQPDVTPANTTITFAGSTNGTCANKTLEGSGANEKVRYSCTVPKGWTGAITVTVDPTGGSYTYRSPEGSPCTGSTSGSCTMATITNALGDIDGTSATATTAQTQQTNVTARR